MSSPHLRAGLAAGALASALAVAALPRPATAATIFRYEIQNAVGNCQAPLPAYDAMLRKRPLAISNEGNAAAFVSCSLPGEINTGLEGVEFGFTNRNAAPVAVTCTLLNGDRAGAPAIVKTVSIQPDPAGVYALGFHRDAENGGQNFSPTVNASCILPPDVDLVTTYRHAHEPIGE